MNKASTCAVDERLSTEPPFSDSYSLRERDPVSDPGPILKHRSGPSSRHSGPITGFLACVEGAPRLRLPSAPFHRRGPTGLHRTQFRNPNRKSRKREKKTKIRGQMPPFARDEVGTAK